MCMDLGAAAFCRRIGVHVRTFPGCNGRRWSFSSPPIPHGCQRASGLPPSFGGISSSIATIGPRIGFVDAI